MERIDLAMKIGNRYEVVCRDKHGNIKWVDYIDNAVVKTGLDDVLDKYWKGSAYTAAHYVGLTGGTPVFDPDDTMLSHVGWTDVTAVDEAARQAATWGSVAAQSVNSSAAPAVYTIDTNNTTIGGAFITTSATKGGTAGTLIGGGALAAGDKVLDDDDTLSISLTSTLAAA